jgi:predicted transposase YdaD
MDQPKHYDVTFKHLLEARPRDVLELVHVPDVLEVALIDANASALSATADKVLRVVTKQGEFLAHFEFQSGSDKSLVDRVFWYNAVLFHRHALPVLSVVVLLTPKASASNITGELRVVTPDERPCFVFRYEVVRLWQVPAETILSGPLGLLPLAPLCQGAEEHMEEVIAQLSHRLDTEATRDELDTLETATYFLLGLRLPSAVAVQLFRRGSTMKESTTYQATVEEGRVEGLLIKARQTLRRLGSKRFGAPSEAVSEKLDAIASEQTLDALTDRIYEVASWEELFEQPASPSKRRRKKP